MSYIFQSTLYRSAHDCAAAYVGWWMEHRAGEGFPGWPDQAEEAAAAYVAWTEDAQIVRDIAEDFEPPPEGVSAADVERAVARWRAEKGCP